jgi:uncharacterized protein (DUF302 family)
MFARIVKAFPAALLALALIASSATAQTASGDGIVRVKSAYALAETVARLKKDIAAKGIRFFQEVDQHQLAAEAGITVLPSTLLVFGNPPLGTQFLNAKPEAGIDWPVRLLVQKDEKGDVWAIYTDFLWIARRHAVKAGDRKPFETASGVIASITSSVQAK